MNYRGIEYVIRAALGRNEWTIVISFPEASEPLTRSSVISSRAPVRRRTRKRVNAFANGKNGKGRSHALLHNGRIKDLARFRLARGFHRQAEFDEPSPQITRTRA